MVLNDKITQLLDRSILFTPEQKQDWSLLLPQMNNSELQELYGILADEVKELKTEGIDIVEDPDLERELIESAPEASPEHGASIEALKAAASGQADAKNAFAKELQREVETPELNNTGTVAASVKLRPSPVTTKPSAAPLIIPKPPLPPAVPKLAPLPKELRVPTAPVHRAEKPVPAGALKSLLEIRTVDDLKKIRTLNLRQGELAAQIELIRAKIISVAQANKLLPFYTVSAFEESPLYKTYLAIGSAMIVDADKDRSQAFERAAVPLGDEKLTMREFEAVADLRKEIEQL